jgi:hypothetical protein
LQNIEKHKNSVGYNRSVPQDLQEIQQAVMSPRAHNVLFRMISNAEPLSAFGMTESEVLSSVWGRIQDPVNQERKNDLIESLNKNLEDCYDNDGTIICATGRTTHVMQTLEGGDLADTVSLKPKWALDQEIQNIGAHVYQQVLQTCTPDQQHACTLLTEDASPEQARAQQEVKDKYTEALKDKLNESYKDILSPAQIEARVETLAELT